MSEASDLADFLRGLRALQRLVAAETEGVDPRWVEQANSTLGRRRHIEAVKRRVETARTRGVNPTTLGAVIDGRRYLLSQESMAEELGDLQARGVAKARARKAANDQARADAEAGESDAYRHAMAVLSGARGRS